MCVCVCVGNYYICSLGWTAKGGGRVYRGREGHGGRGEGREEVKDREEDNISERKLPPPTRPTSSYTSLMPSTKSLFCFILII